MQCRGISVAIEGSHWRGLVLGYLLQMELSVATKGHCSVGGHTTTGPRGACPTRIRWPRCSGGRRCAVTCVSALGLLVGTGVFTAAARAETRGYAIALIHTATYADTGNCPRGGNGSTTQIHERILMAQGFTKEQADKILTRGGVIGAAEVTNDGVSKALKGGRFDFDRRGNRYGQRTDVGDFPTSVPDPHIETVQGAGPGHYAYGFNLAGKATPYSFEDPESHELVQDQMWRVLGCFTAYEYRLPAIPYNEGIAWDTAEDSMPAWLLSISGGDLGKDGDVTVTFDRALDVLMRNAGGAVLSGSSYTVDPDPRSHSVFQGHIKNHVLTIEPGNFSMQGESQFYALLRFSNTHLRLSLNPDGTLRGFIGGYQPWLDYFQYLAIRGQEDSEVDLPGVYYAMKRLADAEPGPNGQNTAISATYYIEAAPVFITNTAGQVVARAYEGPNVGFSAFRTNAIATSARAAASAVGAASSARAVPLTAAK